MIEDEVDAASEEIDDLTPAERLREAASWNLVMTRLELAAARAREEGHPAPHRSP